MFNAILLPIDLGAPDASTRALKAAAELGRSQGAILHVLSVVPDFGMSIVGSHFEPGFERKALDDAEQRLRSFCAERLPADLTVRPHIAHGSIYAEILRAADALNCDLIVMAAHRPELKDFLLGPNAARVVRHARQSVFVIRDDAA